MADRGGTPRGPAASPMSSHSYELAGGHHDGMGTAAARGGGGGGSDSPPGYSEGWTGHSGSGSSPGGDLGAGGGGGGGDYDDSSHDDADSYGGRSPSRGRRDYRPSSDDAAKNFKVVIRVRPPLPRELHGDRPFENTVRVDATETSIIVSENLAALDENGAMVGPYASHAFTFDHVYDQNCDQKKVYETTAMAVVESSLAGYNATIFAVRDGGLGPVSLSLWGEGLSVSWGSCGRGCCRVGVGGWVCSCVCIHVHA